MGKDKEVSARKGVCSALLAAVLLIVLSMGFIGVGSNGASDGFVVLSFDDGYQRQPYDLSEEVMDEFGYGGVAFVCTDYLDGSWDIMARLQGKGWEIASHTCSHPDLRTLTDAQLIHEIEDSKAAIEGNLSTAVVSFCYPYGSWNATNIQYVRAAGYLYACGSNYVWNGSRSLLISRVGFSVDTFVSQTAALISKAESLGHAVACFHAVNDEGRGYATLNSTQFRWVLQQIEDAGLSVKTFKDLENPEEPGNTVYVTLQPFGITFTYNVEAVAYRAPETVTIWGHNWTFTGWTDGYTQPDRYLTSGSYEATYA